MTAKRIVLPMPSTRPPSEVLPNSKKMLQLWATWTFSKRVSVGKRQRGTPKGAGVPQELTRPPSSVGNVVVVAAVRSSAAVIKGFLAQKEVDMMVDSGSSVSLIEESIARAYVTKTEARPKGLQLISAEGKEIHVLGSITLPVRLAGLKVSHSFVMVQSLICPWN